MPLEVSVGMCPEELTQESRPGVEDLPSVGRHDPAKEGPREYTDDQVSLEMEQESLLLWPWTSIKARCLQTRGFHWRPRGLSGFQPWMVSEAWTGRTIRSWNMDSDH